MPDAGMFQRDLHCLRHAGKRGNSAPILLTDVLQVTTKRLTGNNDE